MRDLELGKRGNAECCIRVVLLDFDGTVVDTMDAYAAKASEIISKATGMPRDEALRLYLGSAGMAFRDQLRLAGVDGEELERAASEFEEWKRRLLARLEVPEESRRVVMRMRGAGLRVYLTTNNECSVVLSNPSLTSFFDGVLCYDKEKGWRKGGPHLREVLAREGVKPCQVLFVGDSDYDIQVYKALGVKVLKTVGLWRDPGILERVLQEACGSTS